MKPAIALLAATLALGLAACANDNDTHTTGAGIGDTPAPADTRPGDTPGTAAIGTAAADGVRAVDGASGVSARSPLVEGDRKALAAMMEVDRHEIAAAGEALARNVEGEVRSYAETLRDDHTRNLDASRRLMGVADAGGDIGTHYAQNTAASLAAAPDTAADAAAGASPSSAELVAMKQRHDAERQRLSALEGEAFTAAWIASMVKGHEVVLARLDDEFIPGASDDGVRQHLQDTRAAISGHLDMARALQSSTTPK